MTVEVTQQEAHVVELLGRAWNEYLKFRSSTQWLRRSSVRLFIAVRTWCLPGLAAAV